MEILRVGSHPHFSPTATITESMQPNRRLSWGLLVAIYSSPNANSDCGWF